MRRTASNVLLIANAGLGLAVANAHRPLVRRGLRRLVGSFAFGVLTSELPRQVLAVQGAVTVACVRRGALREPAGRAAAVVGLASAAGLLRLDANNRRSPEVLETALTQALGEHYAERVEHPPGADPDEAPTRVPGLVRMLRIHKRFVHDGDLDYGDGTLPQGTTLLDVWTPQDLPADARRPVLLQVHGGGWMYGNKQGQAYPLMSQMVQLGWVCVSIGYPLSPAATWPDQIVGVKQAIAWTKRNIADYGGDPDWVAITGGSAGGHLAALAALTAGDPAFQPGFEQEDCAVRACAAFYGVYDWTRRDGGYVLTQPFVEKLIVKRRLEEAPKVFEAASPRARVHADAPPMFLLHGSNDSLVPVGGARALAAELRAVSRAPVAYAELPLAQHAFDVLSSDRARACAVAVGDFLGVAYAGAA